MKKLREKIKELLYKDIDDIYERKIDEMTFCMIKANEILALLAPKDIEWVGECLCTDTNSWVSELPCPNCNGTGSLTRPATLEEVNELVLYYLGERDYLDLILMEAS